MKFLPGEGFWLGAAALSPDGKRAATGGAAGDRTIRLWNAETGDFEGRISGAPDDLGTMLGHDSAVTNLVFTGKDFQTLFSASLDGTVRQWRASGPRYARLLTPGVPEKAIPLSSWVRFIGQGPQLKLRGIFGTYPWMRTWSAETGEEVDFVCHEGERPKFLPVEFDLGACGASRNGERIAVVRKHAGDVASELIVGDFNALKSGKFVTVETFNSPVSALAVSDDGKRVAVGIAGKPGSVRLWEMVGGEPHAVALEGEANSLAFNANATQLAGGGDGVLRLWDLTKPGRAARVVSLPVGSPASLAYNAQGTKIAASVKQAVTGGSDPNEVDWYGMVVRDLEHDTSIKLERGSGETPLVNAVAWDPAGVRIATAENDHTLRIWSVDDRPELLRGEPQVCRLLCTLRDARGYLDSVAWSRDGTWIAGGSPNEGAYLYCGALEDDREAEFLLRELQRENPISRDLKKRWSWFSQAHRFPGRLEKLLEQNGDDPRAVETWAWKQLLFAADDEGVKQKGPGERIPRQWLDARDLIQDVASRWQGDPNLQLLLGVAEYQCGASDRAEAALRSYADPRSLSPKGRLESTQNDYTAKDAIALTYLGMIYSQQGRDKVGREYWNAAQSFPKDRMFSDSPLDQEALRRAENMAKGMFEPAPKDAEP